MSQDSWRGILTQPQTVGRYAYVTNNPTTYVDLLGNRLSDPGAYPPQPRPVTSLPSLRVMEAYASDGGQHTETWVPDVYSYSPDGELQALPARHIQGFDGLFPGYEDVLTTPVCDGIGKFARCYVPRSYGYEHKNSIGSGFTPEQAMDYFKAHATEMFPFPVSGCSGFSDGQVCTLDALDGQLFEFLAFGSGHGQVYVTTSPTSVKFTVASEGYFDSPGSTIEFSTYQGADGEIYLQQVANAYGGQVQVGAGAALGAGFPGWDKQANSLANAMNGLYR